MPSQQEIVDALAGRRQFPVDDPVHGFVIPPSLPTELTPQQQGILGQIGQSLVQPMIDVYGHMHNLIKGYGDFSNELAGGILGAAALGAPPAAKGAAVVSEIAEEAAPMLASVTEKVAPFVGKKKPFGTGYWYNTETNKLHEMDPSSLGPHGDHDGWITLGENAEKLGVDPDLAAAHQVVNFGADPNSRNPLIAEFARSYPEASNEHGKFPAVSHELEGDFQNHFGYSTRRALDPNLPLVRIRKWPGDLGGGMLSLDTNNQVRNPKKFIDSLLKQEPSILDNVKKVIVGESSPMDTGTFLEGKW